MVFSVQEKAGQRHCHSPVLWSLGGRYRGGVRPWRRGQAEGAKEREREPHPKER